MKTPPPQSIDGARVIAYVVVTHEHRHTGKTKHCRGGLLPPSSALAICQYENEPSFYLFGCDEAWNCVTDTYHDTLEDAFHQAQWEYEGISSAWIWIE